MIHAALSDALTAGRQPTPACQAIGPSAPTILRRKRHPDVVDQRCGPRHPGDAVRVRGRPVARRSQPNSSLSPYA